MIAVARLTLAEYDCMIAAGVFDKRDNRRLELIRGELREMTPIGPEHEDATTSLMYWSIPILPDDLAVVRVQQSLELSGVESVPAPDLAWVLKRDYRRARPTAKDVLLVVEVAETSLQYDRDEKAALYATAGIADYWIVNNPQQCVEVYREPEAGRYRSAQTFRGDQEVGSLAFPDAALRPSMLLPPGT